MGGRARLQRFQPPARSTDPVCQGRSVKLDTMAAEDLRLSVERGVIAVFAAQHVGEQSRARQSLRDWPFRRRCLVDRPAGAAAVLRPADAQHAQACRHEVEHLADALTDRMKGTPTAGAGTAFDVDCYVLALKAIGKRLTPWSSFFTIRARRQRRLHPSNVNIQVFETEREL